MTDVGTGFLRAVSAFFTTRLGNASRTTWKDAGSLVDSLHDGIPDNTKPAWVRLKADIKTDQQLVEAIAEAIKKQTALIAKMVSECEADVSAGQFSVAEAARIATRIAVALMAIDEAVNIIAKELVKDMIEPQKEQTRALLMGIWNPWAQPFGDLADGAGKVVDSLGSQILGIEGSTKKLAEAAKDKTLTFEADRFRMAVQLAGVGEKHVGVLTLNDTKLDGQALAAEQMIRAAVMAESVGASVAGLRMGSLDEQDRPLPLPLASDRDPEFIGALLGSPSTVLAVDSVLQAMLVLAWQSHEIDAARSAPAAVLPEIIDVAGVSVEFSSRTSSLIARADDAEASEFHLLATELMTAKGVAAGGPAMLASYQPVASIQTSLAEVALAAPSGAATTELASSAIAGWLQAMGYRAEVRDAMRALTGTTTADRMLAVAESLDCSSHRLDAWATAIVAERRARQADRATGARGLTVGAWGIVEDLAPAPASSSDGWIHAPSTRHATAAGLLRNAHLAHVQGGAGGGPFALDLSSVRLDSAVHVLDGVRQGQQLAALIGYQIERGLGAAGLARLQLSLRTIAPLVAERLHPSQGDEADRAQEAIAATNVVDGLLLLHKHPPGDLGLRQLLDIPPVNAFLDPGDWDPLTADEWTTVTAVLTAAAETVDAVADVMLAESVLQYAGGNPARAAAAMDAMGTGASPAAELDILETQDAAERLTHRVVAAIGTGSGTRWNGTRPRALVEPALEAWASAHLGDPATIVVADGTAAGGAPVTLDAAAWAALDLVNASDQGMLERALRQAIPELGARPLAVRPDSGWPAGSRSIAQAYGLAGTLRAVIAGGTALLPDTLERPGQSSSRDLGAARADLTARLSAAAAGLAGLVDTLAPAIAAIPEDGIVADDPTAAALVAALAAVDAYGVALTPIEARPLDVGWVRSAWETARARAINAAAMLEALAAMPVDTAPGLVVDAAQAIAEAIFGDGFMVLPVLPPPAGANDFALAVSTPVFPAPARSAVRRLIRDFGTVREQVRRYSEILLVGGALGSAQGPGVVQLGERTGDGPAPGTTHWLAGPLPPDGPWPAGPVAHLLLDAVGLADASQAISGLVIDAWVEDLPNQPGPPKDPNDVQPNEISPGVATTGLAVRANGASARAPQAVLCAISPDGRRWTTESLLGVITSTLDLAKLRLIRLDQMPGDAVALPALYLRSASLQGEKVMNVSQLVEASIRYTAMPFVQEVT